MERKRKSTRSYMNAYRHDLISKEQAEEYDSHWEEVLHLAGKYGLIRQAYGGVAVLATHKNIIEIKEAKSGKEA